MGLTLRQAADECSVSRSTIHRALKSGKMSGSKDDNGAWSIDPAELMRAFPRDKHEPAQGDSTGHTGGGADEGAAVLAVKVEMLTDQLERERETVEDLRRRLDKAEERVFALSGPLTAGKPEKGLWGRLRGALVRG